jgi:hypothetical protein
MAHFVGLDVSVKETSVCVVDDVGKVILEQKVLTEPDAIIALLTSLGVTYGRIGIEAGPLSAGARTVPRFLRLPEPAAEKIAGKEITRSAPAERCPHGDDGWGEFVMTADPAAD